MTTPPKPKKVVASEGCCDYLTAGKEYYVIDMWSDINGFTIITDTGDKADCLLKSCAHIDNKDWIITEYEKP